MVDRALSGLVVREDAQPVEAKRHAGDIDDHLVFEIGQGRVVFAGVGGIEQMNPRARLQPGSGQVLNDVGLPAARGSADHQVARVIPKGGVEQIEQHHIAQAGAGEIHAQRNAGVVAQLAGQQRDKRSEP